MRWTWDAAAWIRLSRCRSRARSPQMLCASSKRRGQQAARVQVLQPLAVGDVRLPAGHVLHMVRIHKADLDPARFEDLKERDPEHAVDSIATVRTCAWRIPKNA